MVNKLQKIIMRYIYILFLLSLVTLTSCERSKETGFVKKVSIKETLPVTQIESNNITEEHVDLFAQTIVINSQEKLTDTFNSLEISNCDEINTIDYEKNTLLVRFFVSFNLLPVSSVAHSLYYYPEEKYYEYYLQLESLEFKETDNIVFYYTGIIIDKIEDSFIKASTVNRIGKK